MEVLRSFTELREWAAGPVAFTVGFFDGVHRGHQALVAALRADAAARHAQSLLITFENSPRGFHVPGKRFPFLTMPDEKLYLLDRTGVDATLLLRYDETIAGQTAAGFIRHIDAHATVAGLTIGYDSRFGCDMVGGRAGFTNLTTELGIGLTFVDALLADGRPVKSRETRQLTREGRMAEVRGVLGHPYFAMGLVSHGKGKGTTELNVPTANLVLPWQKLTPPVGIYAGVAEVAGTRYPAAMCVMTARQHLHTVLESSKPPALDAEPEPQQMVIEAHLLDFTGSLYGQVLKVDFLKYLRGWISFATPEELRSQIRLDIAGTRAVIAAEPGLLEV